MRAGGDVGGRRPVAGIGLDLVGAGGSALAVLRALTGAAGGGQAPGVGVRVVPGDGSAAEVTERILVAEDDPADSGYPDPLAEL